MGVVNVIQPDENSLQEALQRLEKTYTHIFLIHQTSMGMVTNFGRTVDYVDSWITAMNKPYKIRDKLFTPKIDHDCKFTNCPNFD